MLPFKPFAMRNLIGSFLIISSVCFASCKQQEASTARLSLSEFLTPVDTGVQSGGVKMVEINTPAGKFKVWTKRIGNSPTMRLLLLHGGPAATHEYFECLESFFPKEAIEIIEYDQLGSYYSDQPADSSLWMTDRFVEEVEQVRKALHLNNDNFYLLGHSWGGILALEYALRYQENLKGLIISNMMSSIPAYEKYNGVLRTQMRKSLVDSLQAYEALGKFNDSVYQGLVYSEYYTQHLCRLPVWPEPVNRSFKHLNETIYVMMQGPSEFKTGGRLLTWDRTAHLSKIKVPTLTIGARFDTMDPEHMKMMSKKVQHGEYLYCANGSHLSMWDDQQTYIDGIIKFIRKVDEGGFNAKN